MWVHDVYGDGLWCIAAFVQDYDECPAACRTVMGCGDGRWSRNPFVLSCGELPAARRSVMQYRQGLCVPLSSGQCPCRKVQCSLAE